MMIKDMFTDAYIEFDQGGGYIFIYLAVRGLNMCYTTVYYVMTKEMLKDAYIEFYQGGAVSFFCRLGLKSMSRATG